MGGERVKKKYVAGIRVILQQMTQQTMSTSPVESSANVNPPFFPGRILFTRRIVHAYKNVKS